MNNIFNMIKRLKKKRIGLALGSGSARGWAHIGVIKALNEAGVKIDYLAGTSIGAFVGAAYASGGIDALEDIVLEMDWKKVLFFLDVVFPKSGLIDGKKVSVLIQSIVNGAKLEDLPLPFQAVSTDLGTGAEIILKKGDIIEAVRASISVPGIFSPTMKDNMILVDGGMVNPVPVSVVKDMGADFVIAVDLNHDIMGKKGFSNNGPESKKSTEPYEKKAEIAAGADSKKKSNFLEALNKKIGDFNFASLSKFKQWGSSDPLPNIFEILITSINIMESSITATRLITDPPDLLIQPKLGYLKFLEFNRAQEAIDEGYHEAKIQLKNSIFS